MAEPIRRCRPRRDRDCEQVLDAWELVRDLYRNHLVVTSFGVVSYRLAKELLSESALDAAVDAGRASLSIDPQNGQRMYTYVERA